MGKLIDTKFWAETLNQLMALAPKPGEPIQKMNADKILEISCKALTLLLDDPEFPTDLEKAITLAEGAGVIDDTGVPNFMDFLDRFMQLENKILQDAGVNTVASRDLEREIRTIANTPDPTRLGRVEGKIGFLQRLACDPSSVEDPKKPRWLAVWRGVKGVGLIGIDAGAAAGGAVVLGPGGAAAGALVVGISASYGANLVQDALRGRW